MLKSSECPIQLEVIFKVDGLNGCEACEKIEFERILLVFVFQWDHELIKIIIWWVALQLQTWQETKLVENQGKVDLYLILWVSCEVNCIGLLAYHRTLLVYL